MSSKRLSKSGSVAMDTTLSETETDRAAFFPEQRFSSSQHKVKIQFESDTGLDERDRYRRPSGSRQNTLEGQAAVDGYVGGESDRKLIKKPGAWSDGYSTEPDTRYPSHRHNNYINDSDTDWRPPSGHESGGILLEPPSSWHYAEPPPAPPKESCMKRYALPAASCGLLAMCATVAIVIMVLTGASETPPESALGEFQGPGGRPFWGNDPGGFRGEGNYDYDDEIGEIGGNETVGNGTRNDTSGELEWSTQTNTPATVTTTLKPPALNETETLSGEFELEGNFTEDLVRDTQLHTLLKTWISNTCNMAFDTSGCTAHNLTLARGSIKVMWQVTYPRIAVYRMENPRHRLLLTILANSTTLPGEHKIMPDSIYIFQGSEGHHYPLNLGLNLDEMPWIHPSNTLRPGQATDSHSCGDVRLVPESMRMGDGSTWEGNQLDSIPKHYTKYTEAYGIGVFGSANVTDAGMHRACYLLRLLLASRYDMRNAMYKLWVRLVIIGDGEHLTDLPEYREFSSMWDVLARGLSATFAIPVVSAGDDNSRCTGMDRYRENDVMLHQLSLAIYTMAARFTIEGFDIRMQHLLDKSRSLGRYKGHQAVSNRMQYFAEASVMYFGNYYSSWQYSFIGHDGHVMRPNSRSALQEYDPEIVELLDQVYPCPALRKQFPSTCCGRPELIYGTVYNNLTIIDCQLLGHRTKLTPHECKRFGCRTGANIVEFNWEEFDPPTLAGTCRLHLCQKRSFEGLMGHTLYASDDMAWGFSDEVTRLEEELAEHMCTRTIDRADDCDAVPDSERTQCGPNEEAQEARCIKRGCCYERGKCFYKKLPECIDRLHDCGMYMWLCDLNPGFMHRKCPLTCNICSNGSPYNQAELRYMCQDERTDCWERSRESGFCALPGGESCHLSCGTCSPPPEVSAARRAVDGAKFIMDASVPLS